MNTGLELNYILIKYILFKFYLVYYIQEIWLYMILFCFEGTNTTSTSEIQHLKVKNTFSNFFSILTGFIYLWLSQLHKNVFPFPNVDVTVTGTNSQRFSYLTLLKYDVFSITALHLAWTIAVSHLSSLLNWRNDRSLHKVMFNYPQAQFIVVQD